MQEKLAALTEAVTSTERAINAAGVRWRELRARRQALTDRLIILNAAAPVHERSNQTVARPLPPTVLRCCANRVLSDAFGRRLVHLLCWGFSMLLLHSSGRRSSSPSIADCVRLQLLNFTNF